jgi:heat shock protein HslJ
VLDGRQFLSTSILQGGAQRPLVPGTRVRIQFVEGRISVSAGCNIIGGRYRIEDGRLVTDALAMTEMGCDQARHAQDDWLGAFIGSRPQLRLAGNDLTLESGDTVLTALDREVAEPDLPLVGRRWTVTAVVQGDTVASVPAGAVATLEITPDGVLRLQTGCNEGGGRVTVEPATLEFGEIVTTLRACDDPAGGLEAAVLSVLRAEKVAYRIEAGTLALTAGDRGLQLQAL